MGDFRSIAPLTVMAIWMRHYYALAGKYSFALWVIKFSSGLDFRNKLPLTLLSRVQAPTMILVPHGIFKKSCQQITLA